MTWHRQWVWHVARTRNKTGKKNNLVQWTVWVLIGEDCEQRKKKKKKKKKEKEKEEEEEEKKTHKKEETYEDNN